MTQAQNKRRQSVRTAAFRQSGGGGIRTPGRFPDTGFQACWEYPEVESAQSLCEYLDALLRRGRVVDDTQGVSCTIVAQ